jgi:anti-sigma regulatory factor (Ser/Thr protein kinase)/anti-anti-sigma regulatory factor
MSGAGIECQVRRTFPIGLIEVAGSLRLDTTSSLREAVLTTLAERPDAIVLNLAGLEEVEARSLAVFPALGRAVAAAADGELILAAASPGMRDVLRRAAPLFVRTFDTCDQALEAAARAPARRRVTRQLPADPHAGRTARRVLDEVCRRWELHSLRDPALMIVTELATNAVQHVGGPIELCVTVRRRVLRIELSDRSTVLPTPLDPVPGATLGNGLRLVDTLANRWGVLPTRWGKTVWANLAIPVPQRHQSSLQLTGAR